VAGGVKLAIFRGRGMPLKKGHRGRKRKRHSRRGGKICAVVLEFLAQTAKNGWVGKETSLGERKKEDSFKKGDGARFRPPKVPHLLDLSQKQRKDGQDASRKGTSWGKACKFLRQLRR